jgi:uncharacterized protein YpuA (DUF1002 family)
MELKDIKNKIDEVAKKIKSDKELQKQFAKEPIKAVESIIGVDLPDDQIKKIVTGVKAKLALDDADSKLSGALDQLGDKLGGLFR